jgi:long-chain acyl-CoA synthetase
MPLRMGMTVIPELQFEKERIIDGIKKYKPTMTLNPTSIWMALAQSKKWKRDLFLNSLRTTTATSTRLR